MQDPAKDPGYTRRDTFLPFSPPDITDAEIESVVNTLRSQWLTTGPSTRQFEQAFASYLKAPAALALNSCTAGLHLALVTLGIGPGDEVITTPMTFSATVNVIEHTGATPVLVDIDPETLNIDPGRIADAITPQTRAILPVHYAGHPCEMTAISDIASTHGLYIIEDAAHALPAKYRGKPAGTLGDFGAFSFYATKNLTTGEGGMLIASPEDIEEARILSLHGMSRDAWLRYQEQGSWYYEVVAPGYKYNMTDLQAAIGLVQLERLEGMYAHRRHAADLYRQLLSECDALEMPVERAYIQHAWHLFVVRLNPEVLKIDRARFIEEMKQRYIGTGVHFIPVHLHPYYAQKYGWKPEDFPIAYREYSRLLSIPMNSCLSDNDIHDVVQAALSIADTYRR